MAGSEVGSMGWNNFQIDEDYEFSAPRFFDFSIDETEEEIRKAELWFDSGKSDAPSPYMMRIKASRFEDTDGVLCDFEDAKDSTAMERQESDPEPHDSRFPSQETEQQLHDPAGADGGIPQLEMEKAGESSSELLFAKDPNKVRSLDEKFSSVRKQKAELIGSSHEASNNRSNTKIASMACIRSSSRGASHKGAYTTSVSSKLKKELPTKKASGPSKPQGSSSRAPTIAAGEVGQDSQAIKRQRLDNGSIRQIHSVKSRILHHKSRSDLMKGMDSSSASGYLHEEIGPYISVAEMIKKFESKTREVELKCPHSNHDTASAVQRRQRLVLTRPKEPELQTAHRVRAIRIKSSADLEAEMLAKIPKFKARPVNKKILEAPSLPPLPKSTPQAPEFREFNLKTMERFEKGSGTQVFSSSTDSMCLDQGKVLKLTEARPPLLETALRARPSRIKTTEEEELEELEKAPRFKAIPLNKKILESKGDIGLPYKPKSQVTVPQEFKFATTERLGPSQHPSNVVDLFDKLSIYSSEHNEHNNTTRLTVPNPFNLQTEERGMEKEKRFTENLIQKQMVEEKSRVPKANPYPYTTDYPVIPPKPQPRETTRSEVFQLESLVRHNEEKRRKLEIMDKMEKEETHRRIFRAQPIMKEDPLPLPEKKTRPLTEVQEVVLHVDNRAGERSEFDKKIKERELILKRLRDDTEHAKRIEEEKALKQMRRTMVPQARPVPNFSHPFLPHKSIKEKTKAKSPKLRAGVQRDDERRRHYMR